MTVLLAATALCVIVFERPGLGAIPGFIITGNLARPHPPDTAPVPAVEAPQSVTERGMVLFVFTVGLEMRPENACCMRGPILRSGLGADAHTAADDFTCLVRPVQAPRQTAILLTAAGLMLGYGAPWWGRGLRQTLGLCVGGEGRDVWPTRDGELMDRVLAAVQHGPRRSSSAEASQLPGAVLPVGRPTTIRHSTYSSIAVASSRRS